MIMLSSFGQPTGIFVRGGRSLWLMTPYMIYCGVCVANGGSLARISHMTIPKEYTSAFWVYGEFSRTSGAIQWKVPAWPVIMASAPPSEFSNFLERPKSVILAYTKSFGPLISSAKSKLSDFCTSTLRNRDKSSLRGLKSPALRKAKN